MAVRSAVRLALTLLLLGPLAVPAEASAPAKSPRPVLRPEIVTGVLIPRRNPARAASPSRSGPLPPRLRPGGAAIGAIRVVPISQVGALCGDPAIRGEWLQPIVTGEPGCQVAEPVRVHSIGGVDLEPAAVVDCTTAGAMKTWIDGGVKPAIGRLGRGLQRIDLAASHACATDLIRHPSSAHASGSAVDISGLALKNGVTVSVADGWRDPVAGQILRKVHAAACGPFQTVLGPDAAGEPPDRLHLDTALRRGRAYCR